MHAANAPISSMVIGDLLFAILFDVKAYDGDRLVK
jgi:hypothetical protein